MEARKRKMGPATQLEVGAMILAAADLVDTRPLKGRMQRFAHVHRSYAAAQRRVDAVEQQLQTLQTQLATLDAEQDAAVETLARALIFAGQPRSNPFGPFGAASPSVIKKRPYAEETAAIHQLVAAVQRSHTVTRASRDAAVAATQAADALTAALPPLDGLEATRRTALRKRDALAERWHTALGLLKTAARLASAEGAPGLYDALFGRFTRPTTRRPRVAAAPAVTTMATTPPAPAATAPPANGA